MDYKILTGEAFKNKERAIRELENYVKAYMKEGWKPVGSISINLLGSPNCYTITVAQAMMKE